MHKWAKQIMECVKAKVDGIGIDNIDSSSLCELEKWSCIAKHIAEYDYYYNIVKAMEESGAEYGKDFDYRGRYYTPRMHNYSMTTDDYRRESPEYWRDMDRDNGLMYYTESIPSHMHSGNGNERYGSNGGSRYDNAMRGYEESKANHPNDDNSNMKAMETIFAVLEDDIRELKPKMTNSEKVMARNKLTNMGNMLN